MAELQYLDTWSNNRTVGKLSLLDRIRLAIKKATPTLISGLDATQLALMVEL